MRIQRLIEHHRDFISLEFFPPKDRAAWPVFFQEVNRLRAIDPLFVSVTYGAGGSTQDATLEIVTKLKREFGFEPMAHLTCVDASRERIQSYIDKLAAAEIHNILALRGDPPKGEEEFRPTSTQFQHACDLVELIRSRYPDMGVGVAGYPEGHAEAPDLETDLEYLKHKLDRGGDFVITQLFFDNDLYSGFVERARDIGITAPIIPGVLPVMTLSGIKRFLTLSGASMPDTYMAELEDADERGGSPLVSRVGIEFAKEQVRDLFRRGVPGVHLYTLNKADACLEIVNAVRG
ncbi:MAG: methylenetetrahydrofolate reductase [NAD(P)H] [Desulfovibrionales bacterium]